MNLGCHAFNRLAEELIELKELSVTIHSTLTVDILQLLMSPTEWSDTDTPSNRLRMLIRPDGLPSVLAFVIGRYRHQSGHHPRKLSLLNAFSTGCRLLTSGASKEIGKSIAAIVGNDVFQMEKHISKALHEWEKLPRDRCRR
ncbi:hypothetical protein FRC03_005892 [Tulasnella sp. 419]|nr:hypothetical protein FRC03_005892 [Tulasnella sp. 419]